MFNIQEWLKSLQPGASGSMIPVGMMGQPMPATPATPQTPATPVAPVTPATPQYAGPADLSLPSAPNLQGQFPPAPGMGGMLAGVGKAIGTNDGTAGPTAFGGLLKFKDDESKMAAMRGLLGFSAGMLAGGGPSETPTNFGSIAGNALASGVGAYDGYKENQSNLRFKNAQIAGSEREAAAQAAKAAQAQRDAETRARLFGGQGFDGGSQTGATTVPTPASAPMPTAGPVATAPTSDLATQINRQRETYQRQYNGLMLMGDGENARPIFQQMNFLDNEAAKQGLVWDGTKYAPAPGILDGLTQSEAAKTAGRESETRTDDIREYDLYVAQQNAAGQPVSDFTTWVRENKKAGSTQVNVGAGGNGSKYGEKNDTLAAERHSLIIDDGAKANEMIGNMQMFTELGKQVTTGKGAEIMLQLGPWAELAGIDIKGLDAAQAFKSISDRLAPQMRPAGSGSSSDLDVKMFLGAIPNVGNTPEGNAIINYTWQAVSQNKIAAAEIAERAQRDEITWQEADKLIRSLPNPYAGFKEFQKTGQMPLPKVSSEAEYMALPVGAEYIDPKGTKRTKAAAVTPTAQP